MNKMNKISRPLVYALIAVLVLAVVAAVIASGHLSIGSSDFGHGPSLIIFDEDMSDSVFGWFIAIPILIVVAIAVAVILAAVAVFTLAVLILAVVVAILGLALAATPVLLFLSIPFLAIYGFVKLVQRDKRTMQAAGVVA
jgi:uncharacterized membrane protein